MTTEFYNRLNNNPVLRSLLLFTLSATLLLLFLKIISPFIQPMLWSVIAVTLSWPIATVLQNRGRLSPTATAFVMSLLLALTFALLVLPASIKLSREVTDAFKTEQFTDYQSFYKNLALHPQLSKILDQVQPYIKKETLSELLLNYQGQFINFFSAGLKNIAGLVINLILVIFFSFFLFRDGASILENFRKMVDKLGGVKGSLLMDKSFETVRATIYGTLATALAQGTIAGVGFWLFNAPLPVFFGFLTMIMSFIPFGGPIVYLPLAVYQFIFAENWIYGIFIAVWGMLFVSTADNIIRSYFIAQATKLSFLSVFLGIVGGIFAFGMIGIFIGPVIVALVFELIKIRDSSSCL